MLAEPCCFHGPAICCHLPHQLQAVIAVYLCAQLECTVCVKSPVAVVLDIMPGTQMSAAVTTDCKQCYIVSECLQAFNKVEAVEINIAAQECCDIIRSIMAVGLEKALSGVRA